MLRDALPVLVVMCDDSRTVIFSLHVYKSSCIYVKDYFVRISSHSPDPLAAKLRLKGVGVLRLKIQRDR